MGSKGHRLGELLFSKTQRRVFALLFGHPQRSFYSNEIVRYAETGIGTVHRELARLEAAGVVLTRRIGNQKHYQANPEASIYDELRGIVLKTFGVAEPILNALSPIRERIAVAFVFGSVAAGDDTADSDIDLMIISDTVKFPELLDLLSQLEREVGRNISPVIYGIEEWRRKASEKGGFVQRVLGKPKLFLIGAEGDLAQSG